MEKWESESLEWIHRVRGELMQENQGMDLWKIAQKTEEKAQRLIKQWGLTVVKPQEQLTFPQP